VTFLPLAEGAVSWNGFLKQVGFGGTQVYEVSDTTVIPAGETTSETLTMLCNDGDWMFMGIGPTQTTLDILTNPLVFIEGFGFNFITDPVDQPFLKTVGTEGPAQLQTSQVFDVEVFSKSMNNWNIIATSIGFLPFDFFSYYLYRLCK